MEHAENIKNVIEINETVLIAVREKDFCYENESL